MTPPPKQINNMQPFSNRTYTERQRRIVERFYAKNSTEDVAEAAQITAQQARSLAARIGVRKAINQSQKLTPAQITTAWRYAKMKHGHDKKRYTYPKGAVLCFEMVTGFINEKSISGMREDVVDKMRDTFMLLFPKAISSYVTIPSKANT